ncbi:neuronal cell adhesion molecule [Crotalus adamanteus]|uniref:Neuronal cell adhesion molecule n=1 Tax=Crotalus adamanteus TaxID=8729 RepID=A0AAW1BCA0_CROAD
MGLISHTYCCFYSLQIEDRCEAKGKPSPTFSWTRNGTHFDIEKDPRIRMKPHSGTLLINIINEESGGKAELYEGIYQCTARNVLGAAISNNIVIRASRSPLWTKEKLVPETQSLSLYRVIHLIENTSCSLWLSGLCSPPQKSLLPSQRLDSDYQSRSLCPLRTV